MRFSVTKNWKIARSHTDRRKQKASHPRCFFHARKEKTMAAYRPAELIDTVSLMNSTDYKERFKAEYMQVCIRYEKLKAMLDKWDTGKLNFTPTCPRGVYNFQIRAMADYIASLEARAAIESIEL